MKRRSGGLRVALALVPAALWACGGCPRAPRAGGDGADVSAPLPAGPDWAHVAASVYLLGEEYDEAREKNALPQRRQSLERLLAATVALAGEAAPDLSRALAALFPRLEGPVDYSLWEDCGKLSREIAARARLPLAPAGQPSLERGAQVYASACAACHGTQGDGKPQLKVQLDPRPSDLMHPQRSWRPYDMFARVTYGGWETAMPAFGGSLSAQEVWDLVFYLFAARWFPCRSEAPRLSAAELAVSSDFDLSSRMPYEAIACARRSFTPPAPR